MRLRNIPQSQETLDNDKNYVIQNIEEYKKLLKKNKKPLNIEIGMGKGDFIFQHASLEKGTNFIGIERYPTVLYLALKNFLKHEEKLTNLKIVDLDAKDLLELFPPKSVDKIFITFSDPWPKNKHAKRRLLHRNFLTDYKKILKDSGEIEFKTDQKDLFEFGLEEIAETKIFKIVKKTNDLHSKKEDIIMTNYEKKFVNKGYNIYWMKFIK